MQKIAIIGAGMAGVACAHGLKNSAEVILFDKGYRVGGRMATRAHDQYSFDFGAQFFFSKDKSFNEFIQPAIDDGLLVRWQARFVEIRNGEIASRRQWDSVFPHWIATPRMNQLCEFLTKDLKVYSSTKIDRIIFDDGCWTVIDHQGHHYQNFDGVILAIPAAQAKALLPENSDIHAEIAGYRMQACFALMLGFDKQIQTDWDAALVSGGDISWISVNHSKPNKTENGSLTILSTNDWADAHIEHELAAVKDHLMEEANKYLQVPLDLANHIDLHRWRYANMPTQSGPKSFFDAKTKLGVCGDWCIKGNVQAAYQSGQSLAKMFISED